MSEDQTVESLPPAKLREAVSALWRIPPPGPPDLFEAPEFARLHAACRTLYPRTGARREDPSQDPLSFAISNALCALDLPCRPAPAAPELALPAGIAAARLHAAFERQEVSSVYLCPLDKADALRDLTFGPNRIDMLTALELEKLVDQPRLTRIAKNWTFDAERFSEFAWLVVNETSSLRRSPAERAIPWLFQRADQDWGRIEPHSGRFPAAVEDALFAILLAPWEDWIEKGPFWRGFEVPWVYPIDDDIFVRPSQPPSPDTLSWEPVLDNRGAEIGEWPSRISIGGAKVELPKWLNDTRWDELSVARKGPLFETPIQHFFVKAFVEEPLDEFLAHVTTIEAALLLPTERKGLTTLVKRRVSKLLGGQSEGKDWEHCYNQRCSIVHGRRIDGPIPGEARLKARRLARKVVHKLVEDALTHPLRQDREAYLKALAK